MKAWLNINEKFFLTIKWKAYLKNNPNYNLSKVEWFLTDYPLFFTNLIAWLALIISIIALYKN
jgi:hypothetical protein